MNKGMTALEAAKKRHPDMEEDLIVRFGCPYLYGVGKRPAWWRDEYLKTVDRCRDECWGQKVEGK